MTDRRALPALAALLALLLAGCASQTSQAEYIGIAAAKAIALEDAGASEAAASFSSAGLDRRSGTDYYAVDFTANGQCYEYDIDAVTGVIITGSQGSGSGETAPDAAPAETAPPAADPSSAGTQTDAGASSPQTAVQTQSQSQPQSQSQSQTQAQTSAAGSQQTAQAGTQADTGLITESRAREIALAHAGLAAGDVTFLKTKLDYDDGRAEYDVEFYTADYTEYDYEIDAATGAILSFDYDAEGCTAPAGGTAITADQAKAIALAEVPGAAASDIWEFEVDRDDGRLEYEGTIWYGGVEYEFTIDGYSGAIREWEADFD